MATSTGFLRADGSHVWDFPADFGPILIIRLSGGITPGIWQLLMVASLVIS